ncbi:MAG TPA: MBL fold metallo-hydrolase [Gemmatimonadaceae bacterium]
MRFRLWGTRGSCPSPGPTTIRYGGNTTCVEVRGTDDRLLILDAGTGIRELGRALLARARGRAITGDLLFSHAHWDHIQGLPFFTPAFQAGNHFRLFGSPTLLRGLEVVLRQQMSPVVFPVAFDDLLARIEFRELEGHRLSEHGIDVLAMSVRHPGGALGFRLSPSDAPDRSMVFIPDNELDQFGDRAPGAPTRDELVQFARGANLLIHDAMYTGAEYMDHRGWGHSSYRDAVEFAIDADVETLLLFHHEPDRSDDALDEMLALCQDMVRERGGRVRVVAAAEGMELVI